MLLRGVLERRALFGLGECTRRVAGEERRPRARGQALRGHGLVPEGRAVQAGLDGAQRIGGDARPRRVAESRGADRTSEVRDRFRGWPVRRWANPKARRVAPALALERVARRDRGERVVANQAARHGAGRGGQLVADRARVGGVAELQPGIDEIVLRVQPLVPRRGEPLPALE